ncbi:unnamed protein product [Cylindrotheca closterium]|uniref:Reverse transcriptase domain-containing protein n=1 Tax=Cylindrotheca closterium TaxID=2856 RepID=A0AAD2FP36_9STRA|nr:unnamed protein product [Cylindrotheca closterium]
MPPRIGALIKTEKCIRRLMKDKFARGLEIPKTDEEGTKARLLCNPPTLLPIPRTLFQWKPADLSPGGKWYLKRVANLEVAASHYPTPEAVIVDGLNRLRIHRANYTADGPVPKWLQLLWWEFPQEHWEELRMGACQNFVKDPSPCIQPNAPMDATMEEAASAFVDEFMSLGVVRDIDEGRQILTNAPLFVVPKEGQEGQWRVIADMLRGGQNDCVAQDPVYMPQISHIIDEMYTGGYSAVVDLSKFFYNFPTHAEDRPYLGLLHPRTKELVAYYGLAMGAGNSPALACKFGAAFVRLLKERFDVLQGTGRANCYWTGFSEIGFDLKLGYGFILTDDTGGSVLIWAWVNDFLIHGPTYKKTAQALGFFLDTAVDCGEQERAGPGICEYLTGAPHHKAWSRLSLAVAAGILESLTEATPRRLGHTHLRHFHSLVHPPDLGTGAPPYYTTTRLSTHVLHELTWWVSFLKTGRGRFIRASQAATLVPTFGDGSGTGTGGTIHLPGCPFEMWRGKWVPLAYEFPSVWKVLATLKETLLQIKESPKAESVRHTTVLYFTDNSGVYWIATTGSSRSPGLHKLIGEIRLLELELDCMLQVVHVPGLVLISQGTDGLSRGVWMTPFHPNMSSSELNKAIFEPLQFDRTLLWEVFSELTHPTCPWSYVDWNQRWTASLCMGKTTVWFPTPEIAQQLLSFLLNTWIEQSSTSTILFVPRLLESNWRNLSRNIQEKTVLYPHKRTC